MRLRPNRCQLDAELLSLVRAADGYGAEARLRVLTAPQALEGEEMTGAAVGDTLTAFSAVPEALQPGRCYRFELSVLGGPGGERVVVAAVRPSPAG